MIFSIWIAFVESRNKIMVETLLKEISDWRFFVLFCPTQILRFPVGVHRKILKPKYYTWKWWRFSEFIRYLILLLGLMIEIKLSYFNWVFGLHQRKCIHIFSLSKSSPHLKKTVNVQKTSFWNYLSSRLASALPPSRPHRLHWTHSAQNRSKDSPQKQFNHHFPSCETRFLFFQRQSLALPP